MLIINVQGIPSHLSAADDLRVLDGLESVLINAALSVRELGLEEGRDVTVLMPLDRLRSAHRVSPGESRGDRRQCRDIVIEVTGLCEKRERTPLVLDQLAASLGRALCAWAVNSTDLYFSRLKCFVHPFYQQSSGFWTGAIEDACSRPTFAAELVTGGVQIIRSLPERKNPGVSLADYAARATACQSEEAQEYLYEYLKDVIIGLSAADRMSIRGGDYSALWRLTNAFLVQNYFTPVEPIPLEFPD